MILKAMIILVVGALAPDNKLRKFHECSPKWPASEAMFYKWTK